MENYSSKHLKRYNHLIGELEATYHEAALKIKLSDSVAKILYTICNVGDSCLLSEICKQTGLSKQTVNSAIRNMEAQGIVFLKAYNGKAKMVCLTEKGKEFAGETAVKIIEIENDILASWDEEDIHKYIELTERFLECLKEKVDKM